jgi:NTE family protein/lysophospholipid hydrolase
MVMHVDLADTVRAAAGFRGAGPEALDELAAAAARMELSAGEFLFRAGEPSDALYLVLDGELEVLLPSSEVGGEPKVISSGPGTIVGEMQIIMGGRRSADVRASRPTRLARIAREAVQRALEVQPDALDEMVEGIRRRLRRNLIRGALPAVFGQLPEGAAEEIEARLEWMRLPAGAELFHEGDPADDLYIVISGRVQAVAAREGGGRKVLGELGRGESVGELSLLSEGARTATVRALRDADLARLSRDAFEEIAERYPRIVMALARHVVTRSDGQKDRGPRRTAAKTLAVVSLSDEIGLQRIAGELETQLSLLGRVRRVESQSADDELGLHGVADLTTDDPHDSRVSAWLEEQEAEHEHVLLVVDRWSSAWAERCVRRADLVLFFADARADPTPQAAEEILLGGAGEAPPVPTMLVLVHRDDGVAPVGTSRWLDPRLLVGHLHLRAGRSDDFGRVARRVTGNAIGVVLSGGAARCAAQIGVLKALVEAGAPIDMIGGTSAGGGIAGQFAMGLDVDTILAKNVEGFVENSPFKSVTLPMMSLIARRKMDELALAYFGDTRIEDLWIDFFCVSCDLSTGEAVVHRRGKLWKAVRATSSLPGISVPVVEDNHLLVDGGVVDNLPVSVMRELGGGQVVAVDVTPQDPMTVPFRYQDLPGPWHMAWRRINPFAKSFDLPHIVTLLTRVSCIGSLPARSKALNDADLVLRPPVSEHDMLDFRGMKTLADIGYNYAREHLQAYDFGVET